MFTLLLARCTVQRMERILNMPHRLIQLIVANQSIAKN